MLLASAETNTVEEVGIITEVRVTGQKVVGVALEFASPIEAAGYTADASVLAKQVAPGINNSGNRTILDIYVNDSASLTDSPKDGNFVIIEMDEKDDLSSTIYYKSFNYDYDLTYVVTFNGQTYFADDFRINKIVDDFVSDVATLRSNPEKTMQYSYFDPIAARGLSTDEKYPLVLFLHGSGECGLDNQMQLKANKGAVAYLEDDRFAQNPTYVIAPQLYDRADGLGFKEDNNSALVMQIVNDFIAANPNVDTDRIYVQGMSQGGRGTWDIILRNPDFFAAAIPICGNANDWLENDEAWAALKNLPVWGVVASDDGQNGVYMTNAINALKAGGNTASKFYNYNPGSVVPNPHHSWELAYEDQEIYTWLFMQSRARTQGGTINPTTLYEHKKYNDEITIIYDYHVDPMYLIEKEDKALLIDTGMGAGNLYDYIRENVLVNKDIPLEIYFPHNHGDHIGRIGDFMGKDQLKKVYIHEYDSASLIRRMGNDEADLAKLQLIDDGDKITLGGEDFEFITVFGHTKGHTVGLYKDYLFTSDAVGSGYVWMAGGYIDAYAEQLQHLADRIEGLTLTLFGGHPQFRGTMTDQYVRDILAAARGIVDGSIVGRLYERSSVGSRLGTYGVASIVYTESRIHTPKQEYDFDVMTEVFDYGQAVTALIIDAGKPVDGSTVDADTFAVSALHKNPNNEAVVYDGPSKVTGVYVNNSGKLGEMSDTGKYIIVELENGFSVTGSSALVYTGGRNVKLDMAYSVAVANAFAFADGTAPDLPFVQDEVLMPELDLFDYIEYDGAFFRMHSPENAQGNLPLVVWNHGAGETYQNENNEGVQLLANFGGMGWVKNAPEDCYVLVPQRGYDGYAREKVISFIQDMIDDGRVDGNRIYVSGCSAGGAETWRYLLDDSQRDFFAAAITAPGGNNSDAETLSVLKEFPLWMVQTGNDTYAATKAAYEKLSAMDANTKWTSFPVGGNGYPNDHWSWVPTLNNFWSPEHGTTIMDWLFKQVRDKNNFELITQVNEYGQAVVALAIDTKATVNASSVNVDTFDVSAITKNPRNLAVTFDGERKVTNAYVSNTKELGKPVDSGRYIILELEWGFNVPGSTALVYSGRNYRLYMDYTVTQNAPVDNLNFDLYQNGQIDLVVDDFEYITYDDMFIRMYTPEEAADGKPLPLVLWNHGAGETYAFGTRSDGTFYDDEASQILANMGGVGFVVNNDKYPAYVLAPQRGNGTGYAQSKIISYISELIEAGKVDANRIYVAGCSAGGGETLNYLRNYPDFFAAAIPICAAGSPTAEQLETYKDVPMWFVHAVNDRTVPISRSDATVETLRSLNPFDVKYTRYDRVFGTLEDPYPDGHWSWVMPLNNDYVEAEGTNFFDWMFAQSRSKLVSSTEVAEANGEIVIRVSTTDDVLGFFLQNEEGRAISILSVTKSVGAGGRLDWTITTKVGTVGDRVLKLFPASKTNGVMTGIDIPVKIVNPANAYEVISAQFDEKVTFRNTPTNITIVTGGRVSRISIVNTENRTMGKSLVSKTKNDDGTITWVYTTQIGSAGQKRDFKVFAANAEGVFESYKPISIAVLP